MKNNKVAMLEVGYKFCKYLRRFLCLWLLGFMIYIVMLGGVNEVHMKHIEDNASLRIDIFTWKHLFWV